MRTQLSQHTVKRVLRNLRRRGVPINPDIVYNYGSYVAFYGPGAGAAARVVCDEMKDFGVILQPSGWPQEQWPPLNSEMVTLDASFLW